MSVLFMYEAVKLMPASFSLHFLIHQAINHTVVIKNVSKRNKIHLKNEVALCGFPQGSSEREAIATEEMSTLVNYVQPTKFNSFEASKSKKSRTEQDDTFTAAHWFTDVTNPEQHRFSFCVCACV